MMTLRENLRSPVVAMSATGLLLLILKHLRSKRALTSGEIPENTYFLNLPFVGHLLSLIKLMDQTESREFDRFFTASAVDGVCRMKLLQDEFVLVGDPDLVQQLYTDTDLIGKTELHRDPTFTLGRQVAGNGLFTVDDSDEMWGVAHRILTKPFSREGMMAFVPMMNAQADKLVELIIRDVGDGGIGVFNELVTKMAFETIAYCGMGTSFGSFESTEVHPFVSDINEILVLMDSIINSPVQWLPSVRKQKRDFDVVAKRVRAAVKEIVAKRRNKETSSPGELPDLLDLMLYTADPKTGRRMTDEDIINQIITFLVAGHDTTAAAMSFFLDFLTANPQVEAKLVREIENVVGNGDVKFEDLNRLKYLDMCQKEALRLQPPARLIVKTAKQEGFLGKFRIHKGMLFLIPFQTLGRSEKIWGPDAELFVPERWQQALPHPCGYLPFSMGPRGCIGMQFSLVEQKIALVKLLQRFYLQRPQNSPPLQLQSKVFIMPKDHKLKVFLRPDFDTAATDARPAPTGKRATLTWQVQPASAGHDTRLRILYGSNGGSTRDLAQKTASKAQELGFKTALTSMDRLPFEELFDEGSCTVILCATYNGQPPDQSVAFLEFVRSARMRHETPLRGSSFAVFGCGNTQWVTTYQAVPVALDESLEAIGSQRLLKRHEGDSAEDMEKHFELWLDSLWPALASSHGLSLERVESTESLPLPVVAILPEGTTAAPLTLDYEGGAQLLCVAVNRELVDSTGDRSVRHIELDLGSSSTYKAGDHLAVYPENDPVLVTKLMERLNVPEGAVVRLDFSPVCGAGDAQVVTLRDWLLRAVDLSKGSGSTAIGYLASRATVELDQLLLAGMAQADYVQRMQMPLLELLMKFSSIKITLTEVLALLPQMKPRLYSISSSPLALPGKVSITVGVLRGTTASGREHLGVSSNFLAARAVGDRVWASVRNTGSSFRLPPISTPLILVGPGTGVAPLRGFLQELQHQRKHGAVTGDVHLFFGCRTKADFLYEDELKALEADGTLTKLHVAFSRVGDEVRYVQHLIQKQGAALWPLLSNGGHIFVCGDAARMAPDVRDAVQLVAAKKGGMGESKAQQFLQELRSESALKRYHEDVWAGNA